MSVRSRPHDLGTRLLAHGFTFGGAEPGMAVDVRTLPAAVPAPATLRIERVTDNDGLAVWTQTLGQGFGEGEREAAWVGAMYQRIGLDDDRPWRHYLGRLHGTPLATASLFFGAGVAGVYCVFTVRHARRQGIGAAITLTALHDARRLGYPDWRAGIINPGLSGVPALGIPRVLHHRHL